MNVQDYKTKIEQYDIVNLGFDTHARVLNIPKEEVKRLWNEATNRKFKRLPRTEYTMRYMPEISTRFKPYWQLETPDEYLIFYFTPTAPIIIPNGFITDKGSIPWFLRGMVAHDDREMIIAYLVHDLECEMKRLTRFNTDGLLYEVGTELNANWFKKNLIYTAVRAAAWHKVPDSIVRGRNVSEYNRLLIAAAEQEFAASKMYEKHLSIVDSFNV